MAIAVAGAALVCVLVFLLASRLADQTVNTISGMFRAPDLGWPSGVQEDDDLHWTWAQGPTGSATTIGGAGEAVPEPVLQDLDRPAQGLQIGPLHGTVRR